MIKMAKNLWDKIVMLVLVATGGGMVALGVKEFISQYISQTPITYVAVGLILVFVGWWLVDKF